MSRKELYETGDEFNMDTSGLLPIGGSDMHARIERVDQEAAQAQARTKDLPRAWLRSLARGSFVGLFGDG